MFCVVNEQLITDDSLALHVLYLALDEFHRKNSHRYPRADSKADADAVVAIARSLASTQFGTANEFKSGVSDAQALTWWKLARCSGAQIAPITSFAGGVVGQEVGASSWFGVSHITLTSFVCLMRIRC